MTHLSALGDTDPGPADSLLARAVWNQLGLEGHPPGVPRPGHTRERTEPVGQGIHWRSALARRARFETDGNGAPWSGDAGLQGDPSRPLYRRGLTCGSSDSSAPPSPSPSTRPVLVRNQSSCLGIVWSSKVHHLDAGTSGMLQDIEILAPLTPLQPAPSAPQRRGSSEPGLGLPPRHNRAMGVPAGGEDEPEHLARLAASNLLSGCYGPSPEPASAADCTPPADPSVLSTSTLPYLVSSLNSHMERFDFYPSFGHEARSPSPEPRHCYD
jgi:hypothetical protein